MYSSPLQNHNRHSCAPSRPDRTAVSAFLLPRFVADETRMQSRSPPGVPLSREHSTCPAQAFSQFARHSSHRLPPAISPALIPSPRQARALQAPPHTDSDSRSTLRRRPLVLSPRVIASHPPYMAFQVAASERLPAVIWRT